MKTKACRCCEGTGREIDHVSFGQEMKARRLALHIKQYEIARRMGFSAAYISDLEAGKRHWSKNAVKFYNKALEAMK